MDERQDLSGRCVLIVEDRYLIAAELAAEVRSRGAEVLGPAGSLARATELLGDRRPDVALLDINLDGDMVFPLAAELAARGSVIIFLTGYESELLPEPWRGCWRLSKPVDTRLLRRTLHQVLNMCSENQPM